MSVRDRLIGADASLFRGTPGASPVATGAMVAGSFYKIATISGVAVFPAGYEVGDIFIGDVAKTLTAGNSAYLLTTTEMADTSEFSIQFSADEIEVTTLTDDVKKYRRGKTDMSGTVSGINFVSEMKKVGSVLNRFLRIASASSVNAVTAISSVDGSDIFGIFYLQDDGTTAGETQTFMVAQIELFGYNLGAAVGDAQSWESGIRVIGNDPIVYFKANS